MENLTKEQIERNKHINKIKMKENKTHITSIKLMKRNENMSNKRHREIRDMVNDEAFYWKKKKGF